MNERAQEQETSTAPALCEVRAIRCVSEPPPASGTRPKVDPLESAEHRAGLAGSSQADDDGAEDQTFRMFMVDAEVDAEDETSVDSVEVFRAPRTDYVEMSTDLLAQLKERLRVAEARENEASGVRARPTPPEAPLRGALAFFEMPQEADPLAELHVEVDAPRTFDEWTESISTPLELEVPLAPHSENNFYGGFDDDHPDGLFIATYRDLAVGTPVYAKVLLPGGLMFRTAAFVEFSRGYEAADYDASPGVGLRMCGLDARMRRLIREFVQHRPPMFYVG